MVYEQGKHLPIACRYVPYDQWFITHIDPTWKIKHLKQRIISKCLNLPVDPRLIQRDATPNARPPSPITFAPDTSIRPDSPIEFAVGGDDQESIGGAGIGDEGYDEDDEREQDLFIRRGLYGGKIGPSNVKVRSKSSVATASPPFRVRLQQQQRQKQKQDQEQQITTHTYTMLRFSTGQILEEDFEISWYDIQPHELVELHSSFSPPTFASSLLSPMSIPTPLASVGGVVTLPQANSTQKKKKPSSTKTTDQGDPVIPSITALPRHLSNLYIQPYWQGWVRTLRILWRMQTASDEDPHTSGEDDDHFLKGGKEERGEGGDWRHREKAEWKDKWVVIHDGVVNICRSPNDPNPTRLPLSSLMALRGPEYLADSLYTKNGTSKSLVRSKPRTPELSTLTAKAGTMRTRSLGPSISEALPNQIRNTAEIIPDREPKRNARSLHKPRKDGKQQLFSATSSPSLRSQDRQPRLTSTPTPTPMLTTTPSNSKPKSPLPLTAENSEREREKLLERKKARERAEREIETLKKWDDRGFSFTLGGKDKSKDKEKSKGKDKDRGKDKEGDRERGLRERELRRILPVSHHSTSQQQQHRDEKERRTKYSEHGDKDKSRPKSFRDKERNKTFIPTSREEAEQAGMRVVCVKFRVEPPAAREWDKVVGDIKQDGGFPKARRYTSTGPSLALVAASAPGIANVKGKTPHEVIHSGVYVGESPFEDFEHIHGQRQPQPQPQEIVIGSDRTASKLEKDTEFGDEPVSIAEPSDMVVPSSPLTTRPTLSLTPVLSAAIVATISPESQFQSEPQTPYQDSPNSDSSSSISISSPVFAHSTNESDLDDENFWSGGGTASGMSGVSGTNRPRKGYRYGGYHVQLQMAKNKGAGEDERLVGGDYPNVGKAETEMGVETKFEDGSRPQQARREEMAQEERNEDEKYEGWIALDMINDNAFNSILRILHRHSPLPLSSSFTSSQTIIRSPFSSPPDIHNKPKSNATDDLHHGSKAQAAPSDTDDDGGYAAAAQSQTTIKKAIHPPILESLAARTAARHPTQFLYLALPYPEWRLELVNRARRAGMREIGRPLDLALHGWGREFEEMAAVTRERKLEREKEREREKEIEREKAKKRRSAQSHVSTIKERGRRASRVTGGSDDADDDRDEEGAMDTTQLDSDSQEESDVEWLAWITDLPRQFLVQQSSQLAVQPSPQISGSVFTNPFSSSSLVDDDGPVRQPRTQEEERLLHADKIRKLEPSAISTVIPPPPPTTNPFSDLPKRLLTPPPSSFNHQHGPSGHDSASLPAILPVDDLPINKRGHSRSQSRSLQHLGSYRYVGSVPEEGRDGYNPTASSSRQVLHHSASVDQHLSSWKIEVDSHRRNDSIASTESNAYALGKPILTNEQIMQIESEVIASASAPTSSLPSHWTFPPIPMPSPPPHPPPGSSHVPSHTSSASTSTSTTRPPVLHSSAPGGTGGDVEVKSSPLSSAANRFMSSDLARWSSSVGISLSTPSSPSVSAAVSPNSISPPRSSVFGSLGRSPSLLGKVGIGQEREKKGFSLKKRMSRDLGKEKEKDRDAGESAMSPAGPSSNQRPKLNLSGLSSTSTPHRNHPSILYEIPSPTLNPNPNSGHHLHSPSAISSARALLRRVRSGSSLRGEESVNASFTPSTASPAGLGVTSPETESKEVQRKKKGPIDRIVRGFDSSLAFAEGR
ncbi:hypothetical protein BYT27DRAFT_7245031 [Phlegmacium glaucopus]|nr:hypothetical protein BYT27DRAFT_7245031 [Phlegmacium glaucopus]